MAPSAEHWRSPLPGPDPFSSGLPGGTLRVVSQVTYFSLVDAAIKLVLSGNHYRYPKHLEAALRSSPRHHEALLKAGTDFAESLHVPEIVQDHLKLVHDKFFFSDNLGGTIAPNAEEREVFSSLYDEANRHGLTADYWSANPDLEVWISGAARELFARIKDSLDGASATDSVHRALLVGMLLRPICYRLLRETFGAGSKPATEEGSIGHAAIDIAKALVYQTMVQGGLLGTDQAGVAVQLRALRQTDIRLTYVKEPEFSAAYQQVLVHLSYVIRDLHDMLTDWAALMHMPRFAKIGEAALSGRLALSEKPFREAVIPLTGVGVLRLDRDQAQAYGVLYQGKVRGGVCCLSKGEGSGIVYYDPLLSKDQSWGLPQAALLSFDSDGKLFGSHEGRLTRIAESLPGFGQASKIARTLQQLGTDELDRIWEAHQELFHIIDKFSFSLLIRDAERLILLVPQKQSVALESTALPSVRLPQAEVSELLKVVGITSSFELEAYSYEEQAASATESSAEVKPAETPKLGGHRSIVEWFRRNGGRDYQSILALLRKHFGVVEERGRSNGGHTMLLRQVGESRYGVPISYRDRTSRGPFQYGYLWPLLRGLKIKDAEFLKAAEEN